MANEDSTSITWGGKQISDWTVDDARQILLVCESALQGQDEFREKAMLLRESAKQVLTHHRAKFVVIEGGGAS